MSEKIIGAARCSEPSSAPVPHPTPVAALFVERGGIYWNLPGVDPWDKERDARLYAGPYPVVAHPPCERWGRYWHGSPRKPHQYKLGDDGGCFAAALAAVRRWGGIIEHPAYSSAWRAFGLQWPLAHGGWWPADKFGGHTCHVEQGHYGHMARKATWLYAHQASLPALKWGPAEQRLPAYAVERHGYAKARRIGVMAAIGGKDKTKIRNATSVEFRDLLLSVARSVVKLHGPSAPERPWHAGEVGTMQDACASTSSSSSSISLLGEQERGRDLQAGAGSYPAPHAAKEIRQLIERLPAP